MKCVLIDIHLLLFFEIDVWCEVKYLCGLSLKMPVIFHTLHISTKIYYFSICCYDTDGILHFCLQLS
jgi:hypothetical protein